MVCIPTYSSLACGANQYLRTAIQLARLSGFSPIITTSSLRHEEFLKSIGATHVIDRTLPPATIQAEVAKLAGDKAIEYVYDSISSAETQQLGYEVLAPGGDLVLVNPEAIPAEIKKASDNKKILNVFADVQAPENRDVVVGIWSHVTELFATGKLVVCSICGALRIACIDLLYITARPCRSGY